MKEYELVSGPVWNAIAYLWITIFGACVLASGIRIIRSFKLQGARRRISLVKSAGWCVLSIIAFFVFSQNMYLRFHTVVLASDHIAFKFYWPRQTLGIKRSEFVRMDVRYDWRKAGYLVVHTPRRGMMRSVAFTSKVDADQIVRAVRNWQQTE